MNTIGGEGRPSLDRENTVVQDTPMMPCKKAEGQADANAGTDGSTSPLVQGLHINKSFPGASGGQLVLQDVSIDLRRGECLAIIGGSGSGKSTLINILLGLLNPDAGTVIFQGKTVSGRRSPGYLALRRQSGLVFQNPFDSLDPRWTALRTVSEPLLINRGNLTDQDIRQHALDALTLVGLDAEAFAGRYPVDCSGGQAQRISIARAIVDRPQLLVADEPMSSLDVVARMSILQTLESMHRHQPTLAILLVSHDLGLVQRIADRIFVLHRGRAVEMGQTAQILASPQSEYTRQLIAAACP